MGLTHKYVTLDNYPMANQTTQERITELETELALVKAQQASASSGGQSFSVDGFSVQNVNYNALRDRRRDIEYCSGLCGFAKVGYSVRRKVAQIQCCDTSGRGPLFYDVRPGNV